MHHNAFSEMSHLDDLLFLSSPHNTRDVVSALQSRFTQRMNFTSIGEVVVFINPGVPWDMLMFGQKHLSESYSGALLFALAHRAFHEMIRGKRANGDQSVVVTGESGSGKSGCVKAVIRFLATISSQYILSHTSPPPRHMANDPSYASSTLACERILQAYTILECFTNAKTRGSADSSRLSKGITIQFDANQDIVGAEFTKYFFSKSNSTGSLPLFHAFYQLCCGREAGDWDIDAPRNHASLRRGGAKYTDKEDQKQFDITNEAMKQVGFTAQEIVSTWNCIAGILYLMDLEFTETSRSDAKVSDNSLLDLNKSGKHLGVSVDALEDCLLTASVHTQHEGLQRHNYTKAAAMETRDMVVSYLYDKLVDWLLAKLTTSLSTPESTYSTITCIDITGFENNPYNGLDQLIINHMHDRVHNLYCYKVLSRMRNESSVASGMHPHSSSVVYPELERQRRLDKPVKLMTENMGVFMLLNMECSLSGGSASGFLYKLDESATHSDVFEKVDPTAFTVCHHVGKVRYDVNGFVDQNREHVRPELQQLFLDSTVPILRQMLMGTTTTPPFNSPLSHANSPTAPIPTACSSFMTQMTNLVVQLEKNQCHWVHCLKPNKNMQPTDFDYGFVDQQCRAQGVYETVSVLHECLPVKLPITEFVNMYTPVLSSSQGGTMEEQCQDILSRFARAGYDIRDREVYLSYRARRELDNNLNKVLDAYTRFIQRIARGYQGRGRMNQMIEQRADVGGWRHPDSHIRRGYDEQHAQRKEKLNIVVRIQAWWRGCAARAEILRWQVENIRVKYQHSVDEKIELFRQKMADRSIERNEFDVKLRQHREQQERERLRHVSMQQEQQHRDRFERERIIRLQEKEEEDRRRREIERREARNARFIEQQERERHWLEQESRRRQQREDERAKRDRQHRKKVEEKWRRREALNKQQQRLSAVAMNAEQKALNKQKKPVMSRDQMLNELFEMDKTNFMEQMHSVGGSSRHDFQSTSSPSVIYDDRYHDNGSTGYHAHRVPRRRSLSRSPSPNREKRRHTPTSRTTTVVITKERRDTSPLTWEPSDTQAAAYLASLRGTQPPTTLGEWSPSTHHEVLDEFDEHRFVAERRAQAAEHELYQTRHEMMKLQQQLEQISGGGGMLNVSTETSTLRTSMQTPPVTPPSHPSLSDSYDIRPPHHPPPYNHDYQQPQDPFYAHPPNDPQAPISPLEDYVQRQLQHHTHHTTHYHLGRHQHNEAEGFQPPPASQKHHGGGSRHESPHVNTSTTTDQFLARRTNHTPNPKNGRRGQVIPDVETDPELDGHTHAPYHMHDWQEDSPTKYPNHSNHTHPKNGVPPQPETETEDIHIPIRSSSPIPDTPLPDPSVSHISTPSIRPPTNSRHNVPSSPERHALPPEVVRCVTELGRAMQHVEAHAHATNTPPAQPTKHKHKTRIRKAASPEHVTSLSTPMSPTNKSHPAQASVGLQPQVSTAHSYLSPPQSPSLSSPEGEGNPTIGSSRPPPPPPPPPAILPHLSPMEDVPQYTMSDVIINPPIGGPTQIEQHQHISPQRLQMEEYFPDSTDTQHPSVVANLTSTQHQQEYHHNNWMYTEGGEDDDTPAGYPVSPGRLNPDTHRERQQTHEQLLAMFNQLAQDQAFMKQEHGSTTKMLYEMREQMIHEHREFIRMREQMHPPGPTHDDQKEQKETVTSSTTSTTMHKEGRIGLDMPVYSIGDVARLRQQTTVTEDRTECIDEITQHHTEGMPLNGPSGYSIVPPNTTIRIRPPHRSPYVQSDTAASQNSGAAPSPPHSPNHFVPPPHLSSGGGGSGTAGGITATTQTSPPATPSPEPNPPSSSPARSPPTGDDDDGHIPIAPAVTPDPMQSSGTSTSSSSTSKAGVIDSDYLVHEDSVSISRTHSHISISQSSFIHTQQIHQTAPPLPPQQQSSLVAPPPAATSPSPLSSPSSAMCVPMPTTAYSSPIPSTHPPPSSGVPIGPGSAHHNVHNANARPNDNNTNRVFGVSNDGTGVPPSMGSVPSSPTTQTTSSGGGTAQWQTAGSLAYGSHQLLAAGRHLLPDSPGTPKLPTSPNMVRLGGPSQQPHHTFHNIPLFNNAPHPHNVNLNNFMPMAPHVPASPRSNLPPSPTANHHLPHPTPQLSPSRMRGESPPPPLSALLLPHSMHTKASPPTSPISGTLSEEYDEISVVNLHNYKLHPLASRERDEPFSLCHHSFNATTTRRDSTGTVPSFVPSAQLPELSAVIRNASPSPPLGASPIPILRSRRPAVITPPPDTHPQTPILGMGGILSNNIHNNATAAAAAAASSTNRFNNPNKTTTTTETLRLHIGSNSGFSPTALKTNPSHSFNAGVDTPPSQYLHQHSLSTPYSPLSHQQQQHHSQIVREQILSSVAAVGQDYPKQHHLSLVGNNTTANTTTTSRTNNNNNSSMITIGSHPTSLSGLGGVNTTHNSSALHSSISGGMSPLSSCRSPSPSNSVSSVTNDGGLYANSHPHEYPQHQQSAGRPHNFQSTTTSTTHVLRKWSAPPSPLPSIASDTLLTPRRGEVIPPPKAAVTQQTTLL